MIIFCSTKKLLNIFSLIVAIVCFLTVFPIIGLLSFHIALIKMGLTTNEQVCLFPIYNMLLFAAMLCYYIQQYLVIDSSIVELVHYLLFISIQKRMFYRLIFCENLQNIACESYKNFLVMISMTSSKIF